MGKKKFDTNPLDPDFPGKIAADAATAKVIPETAPQNNAQASFQTRQFTEGAADNETRRYDNLNYVPDYQSPAQAHGLTQPFTTNLESVNYSVSSNRKVDKIGLPENVLIALPYLPWGIGLIAGLVELFLVQKSEAKVRFHAAQGLSLQIAILVVSTALGMVGNFSDWADAGQNIFQLVATICSFVLAYKAYKGRPIHIEPVDDLANWFDDKIHPRS